MAKYPINLDLTGKPVTVIGAGSVGARKIRALCDAGAKVTVVSKNFASDFDADGQVTTGDFLQVKAYFNHLVP